jgi:protein O-GlcNAcase/histone acetyltransferase
MFLADCFYLPFDLGEHAQQLFADFRTLLRTAPSHWGATHERFMNFSSVLSGVCTQVVQLQNRDLLYALYRQVWELKEEIHLIRSYVTWLRTKRGLDETFTSTEHRPQTYRGGLVGELQRLLPMDAAGGFSHRPSLISKYDSASYR